MKNAFDRFLTVLSVQSEALVETARTKNAIRLSMRKRSEAVQQLGEAYYAARQQGEDGPDCAAVAALDSKIAALQARLQQIGLEKRQLLHKPVPIGLNVKHCDACGTALPEDAKFCFRCGSPTMETNQTEKSQENKEETP